LPPTLIPGSRLGPYEIVSILGAGGMGEVYRATDTNLKRQVAVKVLPAAVASDVDRLARFQREAELLAVLNHPNIAHIFGVEKSDETFALVMELVEGATLADRLGQGPIPIADALPIAKQIADALEAAHEQGIIHRDLKPANIKIKPDGTIKVLDFGLAKAIDPPGASRADASMSPTMSHHATQAGMILGTAAYMSPEQASGRTVDRRTDIWSFGIVLWEMLTGRRMFDGETVPHTLADVLRSPIDFDGLPTETPAPIRKLLRRCLDRDVRQRLRDIGEARIVLENARDWPDEHRAESHVTLAKRGQHFAWALIVTIAVGAAGLGWWRSTRPVDRALIQFDVDLGADAATGTRTKAALSPDGTRIVFPIRGSNGVIRLATRALDQSKATAMSGTEGGQDAFFSPDGQWIGFFAGGKLKKVAVWGGVPVTLGDAPSPRGGSWGDDDHIVFSAAIGSGLMRISSAGGTPKPLTEPVSANTIPRWPQVLPGGRAVLFTQNVNPFNWDDAEIAAVSLAGGQTKIVQRGGYFGRYVPSRSGAGHLLYVHESTLFAVPFHPTQLATTGTPVPVLGEVAGNFVEGSGQFDASLNGTLVYARGKAARSSYPISWMDSSGTISPLLAKPDAYSAPRFSPDGTRIAFTAPGTRGPDVWVYDWQRAIPAQLTFSGPGNLEMAWAPDGKHLAFGSIVGDTAALWWTRSDGSGEPQKLFERKNRGVGLRPQSFTPDGRRLAFDDNTATSTAVEIWTLPLDLSDPDHPEPGKPEPFLTSAQRQVDGAFSPDGKWIAYSSNESGTDEVFVRPFPAPGGKWRVSTGNGKFPTWSKTARELFYFSVADARIMVVNYTLQGDSFSAGKPRVWSERQLLQPNFIRVLDLHPDGKRFAVFPRLDVEDSTGNAHVTVMLNFFDELRRRAP
jgi:serine/threonine-protein kinase